MKKKSVGRSKKTKITIKVGGRRETDTTKREEDERKEGRTEERQIGMEEE
jgi:hypothetical protein